LGCKILLGSIGLIARTKFTQIPNTGLTRAIYFARSLNR